MHVTLRNRANWIAGVLLLAVPMVHAAEHVTLANGFELDCVRREVDGDHVRLYTSATSTANYIEVKTSAVLRVEYVPDPPPPPVVVVAKPVENLAPSKSEMQEMLAKAGAEHHIDVDLLASVIHAESGGQVRAVSRTGARGLMQLMPGTATALGVDDSFVPAQNIAGGTKYLDQLLTRYKDNLALALAAYNAGPGAVDRYHGIPPFRETRAYVARVIREFNRRKTTLVATR